MNNILCNCQFFHQSFGGVTRYSSNLIEKMDKIICVSENTKTELQ